MNIEEFLKETAYLDDMDICGETVRVYKSKFDDSYMTHLGMEEDLKFLSNREVTQELTHGVGFSPKNDKWYGWSHRAIYGFEIGSTCNKGDCHYRASNQNDEIEAAIRFWSGDNRENVTAKKTQDGELHVSWEYDQEVPNKKLRGTIGGAEWNYDPNFGQGEWIANTMADAKQMAMDFNAGVS